jgi:hypothetical protein
MCKTGGLERRFLQIRSGGPKTRSQFRSHNPENSPVIALYHRQSSAKYLKTGIARTRP